MLVGYGATYSVGKGGVRVFVYERYSTTAEYQNALLTHVDAVPATCTEDGAEEYWTCGICGKKYSDAAGTTQIDAPAAVAALGHDLVHHDAKEPTCTEVGWEEYDACSRCDYTTRMEIPALGHDYQITGRTITIITSTCSRCGGSAWVYNPSSRNLEEGLVRDGDGADVEYSAGVSRVDEKWVLTVTPDPLDGEVGLYLTPDEAELWLRQGIDTVAFSRDFAALEIDFFVFTLAPGEDEVEVRVQAMIGEEKTPAKAFASIALLLEDQEINVTENGVYRKE